MSNNLKQNPFAWNEIEQRELVSFYTQRQASYKTPAEGEYQANAHKSFYENAVAPEVQIAKIDGYKSEEEINTENNESETPEQSETEETPEVKEEEQTEPQPEEKVEE